MTRYGIIIISYLTILFSVIPSLLYGQNQILEGTILQKGSGEAVVNTEPVFSIPVTLYQPQADSRSDLSLTDINGRFYFYNIPQGEYQLEVWITGEIDIANRPNAAKIFQVNVNYDRAIAYDDYNVLKINPITIIQ